MNHSVRAAIASAILLSLQLSTPAPARAQSSLGQISGSVTDNSGSSIPGASVRARSIDTNVVSETVSTSDGIFNLLSLIPGRYEVTVEKAGFDKVVTTGVEVATSQTATVNTALKVGKVTATVEVVAQAAMLNSSSSEVATTVGRDLIHDLPFTERNSLEVAMLVPGVRGDPNSPGQVFSENAGIYTANVAPGAATNVAGGMPGATSIMVDGSNVTQASIGRTALTVSGPMVAEVTVITNGVPAKYGNTGGGVVIQSTRSGTNELHGQLSWRHNDPAFNAQPLGNTIPNGQHQNFFGVYAGGPVVIPHVYNGKDRTFFFAGYEPARLFNSTSTPGTIATPDELAGKYANAYSLLNTTILSQQGLAAALAAPRTGGLYYQSARNADGFPTGPQYTSSSLYQPIPNNDVSAQLAKNPFASYVLSQMPTPQKPGPFVQFLRPDGLWQNNGYNVSLIRGVSNVDNRYSTRLDHVFSVSDRMFFRFAIAPLTSVRFSGFPLNSPLTSIPSDNSWAQNYSLTENHIFTPTMVNEFKVMYSRNKQTRTEAPASLAEDYAAKYGLTPAVAGKGFPSISLSGNSLSVGTTTLNGQTDVNFEAEDSVTWTKGRHTIVFGFDLRRQQSNQYAATGIYGGAYSFGTGQTNNGSSGGNSIASYILGLVGSFSNTPAPVPGYYRWHYYSGYFQDDIKLKRNLTVNIGMRYEFQTPRIEQRDNQGTFLPNVTGTLNGLPTTGAFCFADNCGLGNTLWPANKLGFEPRIGIGWSPTSRMTVRANFGLMRVPLTGYGNTPVPNFNVNSTSVGGTTGGIVGNQPVDYITNPIAPTTSAYTALTGRGPFFTVQGITVPYIAQTNIVPYVQQWGATIQYQVTNTSMLQVGYTGTVGTHRVTAANPALNVPDLPTVAALIRKGANFSATNIPNPYGIKSGSSIIAENLLQSLNPYPGFFNQALQEQYNREGRSGYHALLVGLTHRMAFGLTLQSSYTWSKSIDNAGAAVTGSTGAIYSGGGPQNPFDFKNEKAVSNFDVPMKWTTGYNYRLPLGKGHLSFHNRMLDNLIGGWTTSGILNVQSGMAFTPTLGGSGYFVSTGGGSPLPTSYALRPDVVAGQSCLNPNWNPRNPFAVPYLNINYFAVPGSLNNPALGNAPRTLTNCRSPYMASLNASLVKKFQLGKNERRYVQLQIDALNATNHALFFFNPNSGRTAVNAFNTASLTNPSVPAFTYQSSFGMVWQPNSALMSRTVLGSIQIYF
jgi:hypothetical protein